MRPADEPSKSERTRARILAAAEAEFARHGFAGTKVEAIASAADIRRATLFYHFTDKAEIYDGVLAELFGALHERIAKLLARGGGEALVEPAISTFFDFLAERPSAARIILREVADAEPGRPVPLVAHTRRIGEEVDRVLEPMRALGIDPMRLMLTVTGASVFFVTATPLLREGASADPEEPARQKAEVVRLVRRLLGLPETTA